MKSAGTKSLKPLTKVWCVPWHVHNHLEESAFVPTWALQVVGKQSTFTGFSWMWWEKMRPCSGSLKVRIVSREALTIFGGSKPSNCLGVTEEERRKKKCPETQSCIYTKLLWKIMPEWSITNSTDVLQCLFLCTLARIPKRRQTQQTLHTSEVIALEKNWEETEDSLQCNTSEIVVIFMWLEISLPSQF